MTVEERLAEWLLQTTPESPRAVTVDDLRLPARGRAWLPVLAAACVVLIALVAVAIANRHVSRHDEPTVTISPTPIRTSGLVSPSPHDQRPFDLVIANGTVWSVSVSDHQRATGSVTISGFAERTLRPRGPTVVRGLGGYMDDVTLLSAPDRRLLLAAGKSVVWIDTATRREVKRLHIDGGALAGAAESPVTGNVYADIDTSHGGETSQLRVLDAQTGAMLASVDEGGTSLVAISTGGVWLYVGTGHHAEIDYAPFTDLAHAVDVDDAGGGAPPTVSIIDDTAWLGGWATLSCADAATGKPRASVAFPAGRFRYIFGITETDGRTFATYEDDSPNRSYLVELHPPAACR